MLFVLTYALLVAAANSIAAQWAFVVFGVVFHPSVALLGPILLTRFVLRLRVGARGIALAVVIQALITLGVGWWLGSALIMRSAESRFLALFLAEIADACVWDITHRRGWYMRVVVAHVVFVLVASTTYSIGLIGVEECIVGGQLLAALPITLVCAWLVARHYQPRDY